MPWQNSSGGSHIPIRVKRFVLRRDNNTCQLAYPHRCLGALTAQPGQPNTAQFDHIQSVAQLRISRSDPKANDPGNLRAVCDPCHRHHSSLQGHQAKHDRKYRRPLPHPGLRS